MKLVKIEDVRVGQIWKSIECEGVDFLIVENYANQYIATSIKKENFEEQNMRKDFYLTGFLGITHEIKDGKLVKIPRKEFQADDVVMFKDGTQRQYVIIKEQKENFRIFRNNKSYKCIHETYGDRSLYDFELKKIGIYGVTHEFVNERLVK